MRTWTIRAGIGLGWVAMISMLGCQSGRVLVASEEEGEVVTLPLKKPAKNEPRRQGPNTFTVSLDSFPSRAQAQRGPMWCWAACASMIHEFFGQRAMTQEEIVERIKGASDNDEVKMAGASLFEVMLALNPEIPGERVAEVIDTFVHGGRLSLRPDLFARSFIDAEYLHSDRMVDELLGRSPVIAGLTETPESPIGHAYVVYSVTFGCASPTLAERLVDGLAGGTIVDVLQYPKYYGVRSVDLIDPDHGQRVTMSGAEFASKARWMIGRTQAAKILNDRFSLVVAGR
ncbi:MAG: hypothetical protein HRU70_07110 [Phycisphaeraceae bacterium]|nr:MAG: hypothetical protein HRU70_07110 [Phycisphaeraceae bacterium]